MPHNTFNALAEFKPGAGKSGKYYSLAALEKAGLGKVSRLPVSIRIVLESVLRNCDGKKVTEEHVRQLAGWKPNAPRSDEIPFVLARIVLQDFTGVPLLADLAAMRNVASRMGRNPKLIEPLVPVDLVVDHSVQIDHYGTKNALDLNTRLEFERNQERYTFLKWGDAGVRHVQGRPARDRHRAPGEPRVPRARRAPHPGRGVLPGHARRHRLAHDDDQRHRRRRLGRRRDRSRSRDARPADVLPHP